MGYKPVHYRKVYLDDEDEDDAASLNASRAGEDAGSHCADKDDDDQRCSDGSYHYSDDHEDYSDDESEHEADTRQEEAAE